MLTQDGQHLLVQVSEEVRQGRTLKRLLIIDNTLLEPSNSANIPTFLDTFDIPNAIMARVDVPLGILAGQKLVFLNKDLWICSLKLDLITHPDCLERHYFLPPD